ncbi:hypothetical protein [Spiroplasma sp. ald]|uniref:hypothetical protein n=1 Tax=Spiroplasma sp. ald TaxID=2490849 RepID=UPI0037DC2E00
MGIKIGIDPSGTGTTAIVIFENEIVIQKIEFKTKEWLLHVKEILDNIIPTAEIINIEDCLYTSTNASKDLDDLLKLIGTVKYNTKKVSNINWVSPRHTKSVVKNIENLSKYNNGCIQEFSKNDYLTYEYGKGWKYNNRLLA